jgi:hypothetical protein
VGRFLESALEIFHAAERSSGAGPDVSDWTILIGPTGEITMVAGCDWPLDSLQTERGARMVFRVSQQEDKVRLEGRAGCRTCLFETAKPDGVARRLLADPPERLLRSPVASPLPLLAGP